MDSEITNNVPPTAPRTEGRKKIRIARIEDTRSRQVTFLKRKNGLLKKAMELGILCDCEVAVIIFNTNNGKLFEYSSVEMEKVLQRYATYSGPSERRKKETFFDLPKSKGTSNIPLNEPALAQTALNAAAAAARRPRPTYKFSEPQDITQEYSSTGRKLSSGETPVGPLPVHPPPLPSASHLPSGYQVSAKRQKLGLNIPSSTSGVASSGVVPPIQLPDLISGRPTFMPFTPRFSSNLPIPAITPNTASRHISSAFGLPEPTPKLSGLTPATNLNRNTFYGMRESEVNDTSNHHQQQAQQSFQVGTDGLQKPNTTDFHAPARMAPRQPLPTIDEHTTKSDDATNAELLVKLNPHVAGSSDGNQDHINERNADSRPPVRPKPNLRVQIPEPNREDLATGTPSGLNSVTTPSSGDENGPGSLQIPRLNAAITSPSANGAWGVWNSVSNGERDGPVPLTPFLNMDTFTGPSEVGNGHLALPSPTDAGLIPLTPRGFGLDSLLSARPSNRSQELGKRTFDSSFDQTRSADTRRPFA